MGANIDGAAWGTKAGGAKDGGNGGGPPPKAPGGAKGLPSAQKHAIRTAAKTNGNVGGGIKLIVSCSPHRR